MSIYCAISVVDESTAQWSIDAVEGFFGVAISSAGEIDLSVKYSLKASRSVPRHNSISSESTSVECSSIFTAFEHMGSSLSSGFCF